MNCNHGNCCVAQTNTDYAEVSFIEEFITNTVLQGLNILPVLGDLPHSKIDSDNVVPFYFSDWCLKFQAKKMSIHGKKQVNSW